VIGEFVMPVLQLWLTLLLAAQVLPFLAAEKKQPKVLFFTAPWCGPCQRIKPYVARLARSHGVEVWAVDFDRNAQLVNDFEVRELPTTILLDPQGRLLLKATGADRAVLDALKTALRLLDSGPQGTTKRR
jgi:thiol-disulfide isomerase/thioredoxin